MSYRAVIFDIGGVILPSPFDAWGEYETQLGLPVGFIRRVVAAGGEAGAWARLERNEITLDEFFLSFEEECASAGGEVSGREVLARVGLGAGGPDPQMLEAVRRIREAGLKTGALTNNWARETSATISRSELMDLFDVVVESSVTGLRKPDPRIYLLTCERLEVAPHEAIFLDDLGMNLKPARALGITTIKVGDVSAALGDLEEILGFRLR